ncbi:MAG: DUF2877 domain-containing protein [Chloroflexota bacterium]
MVARFPHRLRAASWDPISRRLLASDHPIQVHSVFERALILAVPVARDEPSLVAVVPGRAGNAPATLALEPSDLPAFATMGVSFDSRVMRHGETLYLEDRVTIDLSGAESWQPSPAVRTLPAADIRNRIEHAALMAHVQAGRGGLWGALPLFLSIPRQHAAQDPLVVAFHTLRTALSAELTDEDAVKSAIERLVGLGPGLTPSGDDALCGLVLGMDRACTQSPWELAAIVRQAARNRTTDVAFERLLHATNGCAEERVEALIRALVSDPDDRLERAVSGAVAWGHSSGLDTLVGVLLGVERALLEERLVGR